MSKESAGTTTARHERRAHLKSIVSRLGETATPREIREEAYRDGFGAVSTQMLIHLRNELWPNRLKHGGGSAKGTTATATVLPVAFTGAFVCPKCGSRSTRIDKRESQRDGRIKRRRECNDCRHRFITIDQDAQKQPRIERLRAAVAVEKECASCKRTLPINHFGKKANDDVLYRSSCKECLNNRRAANQFQAVLKQHGLTLQRYNELLASQNGTCAICGSSDKGHRNRFFNIDHCHKSGEVRGLLCPRCNLAIGNFGDDIPLMQAAIKYIRQHQ